MAKLVTKTARAMLADARNPTLKHCRRAALCRSLLKHGLYVAEATAALDAILRKPDRTMTGVRLDLARRARIARTQVPRAWKLPLWPDTWLGRLLQEEHGGTLVALEELQKLPDEQRGWPIPGPPCPVLPFPSNKGGDDQ